MSDRQRREGPVLSKVRRMFQQVDGKCHKTTRDGEPDLICCVRGRFVAVETKRPGQVPKPLQVQQMLDWEKAGGLTRWTDDGTYFYLPEDVDKRWDADDLSSLMAAIGR